MIQTIIISISQNL